VEQRQADMRQMAGYGTSGDDVARFLRELRQLRDGAGLGHAELAARAHFPYDIIRAAEVGPGLPDLPVLCAYVRGCGGTTEEWEERWRSLTRTPSMPLSASRNAGRSDAATAGARIGAVTQVGDNPDPSIIIAALGRVAEEMASPGTQSPGAGQAGEFPPADASFPSAEAAYPPVEAAYPPVAEPLAPPAEAFPAAPEPFPPVPPAPEFTAGDNKPAGWDPIRVSTAWPVLRDTPTALPGPADRTAGADPAGGTGMGVPWGKAPWESEPPNAAPASPARASSAAQPAGTVPGTARTTAVGASRGAGGGTGHPASWTRIAVIAAVLVCVIAVLLAVFA
jgi:hypothetical protein